MFMDVNIYHSDLYKEEIEAILVSLSYISEKERKTFEDNKFIRNVMDDLSMYNMTLELNNITNLQYILLASISNVEIKKTGAVGFECINFYDEELNEEYDRLLNEVFDIYYLLHSKYNFSDDEIDYLLPNSRLVNVKINLSVKDLFELIHTCSKYDELVDINLAISENETLEQIVTVANALYDFIHTNDLFIRNRIDDELREELMNHGANIIILSDCKHIKKLLNNGESDMKVSAIGHCSLVAYKAMVLNKSFNLELENFKYVCDIRNDIIFPEEYDCLDDDDYNLIEKYIYGWITFIDKLKANDNIYSTEITSCSLGCFGYIFRFNTTLNKYFRMYNSSGESEISELTNSLLTELECVINED